MASPEVSKQQAVLVNDPTRKKVDCRVSFPTLPTHRVGILHTVQEKSQIEIFTTQGCGVYTTFVHRSRQNQPKISCFKLRPGNFRGKN